MVVRLHGFDWMIYAEHIMPAFASWLIDEDESAVCQLFEQTRCAREEQFLPEPLQRLRIWPRACAFLKTLPRGLHSRREYAKLCSAEQFTALSDHYMYRHPPQLYQNSDALRSLWGAILAEYCLPWSHAMERERFVQEMLEKIMPGESAPIYRSNNEEKLHEHLPLHAQERGKEQEVRSELISLLHAAGLGDLAGEVGEQSTQVERFDWEAGEVYDDLNDVEEADDFDTFEDESEKLGGIEIGAHPNTLHLRGWLASISVRAMALFEYLACGRRCMPFGYEAAEPFGAFIGYLMPDEVQQLAARLHDIQPPSQAQAEEDYLNFRLQHAGTADPSRLVDEVLPAHAAEFLQAVRTAALQDLGLICSTE